MERELGRTPPIKASGSGADRASWPQQQRIAGLDDSFSSPPPTSKSPEAKLLDWPASAGTVHAGGPRREGNKLFLPHHNLQFLYVQTNSRGLRTGKKKREEEMETSYQTDASSPRRRRKDERKLSPFSFSFPFSRPPFHFCNDVETRLSRRGAWGAPPGNQRKRREKRPYPPPSPTRFPPPFLPPNGEAASPTRFPLSLGPRRPFFFRSFLRVGNSPNCSVL